MEFSSSKYKRLAKKYNVQGKGLAVDSGAFEVVMDLLDKLELKDKKEKMNKRSYFSLLKTSGNRDVCPDSTR